MKRGALSLVIPLMIYQNGDIIIWIQKEILEKSAFSVGVKDQEFTGGKDEMPADQTHKNLWK